VPSEKKEEVGREGEGIQVYEGKMKATALAPPKPLSGLGFRRAVRSARVPREADCPMISALSTAPS
jgi:hypothetical protein